MMTVSSPKQDTNMLFGTRFQRRIMLRITPVLVATFLVIIGIAVYSIRSGQISDLRESNASLLSTVNEAARRSFEDVVEDAINISENPAMRDFAFGVSERRAGNEFPTYDDLQRQLLNTFDSVMGRNLRYYEVVRYVHADNSIILQIENLGSETNVRGFSPLEPPVRVENPVEVAATMPLVTALDFEESLGSDGLITLTRPVIERESDSDAIGAVQIIFSTRLLADAQKVALGSSALESDDQRVLLVDANNRVLSDTGTGNLRDVLANLSETSGAFTAQEISGGDYIAAEIFPIVAGIASPWRMVLIEDWSAALSETNVVTFWVILSLVGIGVVVMGSVGLILRRMLLPLGDLENAAIRLAGGKLESPDLLDSGENRDEVDELITSIGGISRRLVELNQSLEEETQRRNRELEIASRIGREVATLYDIDLLLNRAINLICEGYGFYHAQVFLTDEAGMNAVLAHSRGEAGQALLARGHKLGVGSNSVIGTVSATGKPVIINDTEKRGEIPYYPNPLLPDTRAEMGLPLTIGDRVMGALDIHSKEPGVFEDEDLPTFLLVADQLAVALFNARLTRQSDARIEQIDQLNRQLTRQAWHEAGKQMGLQRGYRYNLLDVEALQDDLQPNGGLSSEIRIRNEVIGYLTAESEQDQPFSEADEVILKAVADRVALAIENARLFQETQVSLSETSTLYELSRTLNDANTLDDVLTVIIQTVMPEASGAQIWLFDEFYVGEPEWMDLVTDVGIAERTGAEVPIGMRLSMAEYLFLSTLRPGQVALVQDSAADNRLDEDLRDLFERLNARAAVFIPLAVRNEWRGMISLDFAEPREFTAQEGRIFTALIDQAGVAIDNRVLLAQMDEEVARSENLYSASRIINTAQTMADLVYAAVATSNDPGLEFRLSVLEGELDESGWPKQGRVVAETEHHIAREVDIVYDLHIPANSVMRVREPEMVIDEDPENPDVPELVKQLRERGYQFGAFFPLFDMNRPIAIFEALSKDIFELDPADYEVYRALTGQMSSQIQIRGLLERTEAALDETRRLYIASSAITSALDPQGVYAAAVEHLAQPFRLDEEDSGQTKRRKGVQIAIALAQPEPIPDAPNLEIVHVWGSGESKDISIHAGDVVSSADFPYGRLTAGLDGALIIHDLEDSSQDTLVTGTGLDKFLDDNDVSSFVVQPIEVRQQWFGAIVCSSNRSGAFDEQYLRFLDAVADQVAIAVDNQRLFEQARLEAERAQSEAQRAIALAEAAQLASRIGDDFRQSLGEVFERVAQEAGFDRWMLLLLDDVGEKLEKITVQAPGFDNAQPLEYPVDAPIPAVEAVKLNQRITVNDPLDYPSFQSYGDIERQGIAHFFGKHVAAPVRAGGRPTGSLFVGRGLDHDDLNERDEQLVETLAVQVAIAIENRSLFDRVQREQENLRAILETLPAGVLVLDPTTLKPVQFNEQAKAYFGSIDPDVPFSIEGYGLYRTGTQILYPEDELSIFSALKYGSQDMVDDVAIMVGSQQIDLQVAASPILNSAGEVLFIVAAFQDISNLRSLENTLQENLQETVMSLETQRQLAEANTLDDVLEVVVTQLGMMIAPYDGYVIMDTESRILQTRQFLGQSLEYPETLRPLLDQYEMVYIPDMAEVTLTTDARTTLDGLGIKSLMAIPFRVGTRERAMGWVVAAGDQPVMFTSDHQRMMSQLADMSSVAIDNRLLIQQQQATVNEVRMLYTATNNISRSSGDIYQLQNVLKDTLATLKPDFYAAYLDPQIGFSLVESQLFNEAAAGLTPVDFDAVMSDYEIPSWGIYIDDLLEEVEERTPFHEKLIDEGVRAVAAVALHLRDIAGGFMIIGYEQPHFFTDSEERFMNTVADSASIVFNNILLFEQTQATLEETSILYQAGKALSDATSPSDIVDVVVNYLVGPQVNQVFIAQLEGEGWDSGAAVQIIAGWDDEGGTGMEGGRFTRDQFPAWDQLASRDVLSIADASTDSRLSETERSGLMSLGAVSLVVIPLRVPARVIGAVWVGSSEAYTYSPSELRTLQAFAEQASLSMEAAFLLEQTERRARQLETSAIVSRSASQILDLEELMPQLVDLILDAFGYDHVQIFLMDNYYEYAELRASTGEAGKKLLALKHKLRLGSDSVIGQVTERGEPVIALDTADAEVVHAPNPHLPLTRSEMALPLIIKGTVVGALDVQSNQPNAFNEEDVKALTTLAAQISVAIDNANLYQSAQEQADRMGFLFEITSAAAGSETLDETVTAVSESIYRDMEALSVTIYMTRTYMDENENTFIVLQAAALAGSDQPLTGIENIRIDDPDHVLAQVARKLRPQVIENIIEEANYLPVVADARSAAILPLASGRELVGLIAVEDRNPNVYGPETLQLLATLAGSLTAVLQSKRLLEQLQHTNEQLRELDRLKSDFLANMSHELRTPLNSIIGFSRVMLKGIDGPLTEMQEQDLTTIYGSGQHLLTLINDILDQAKIAADKLELKCDFFEIKPVIEAVKSIGIGLVKENNLSIISEISPNLPQVYGDEVRTRQILINLVSNAAKFTQEGGITIRCYLSTDGNTDKKMVRIDVEDTGIGIAEKDLPLLFEAFRQVDSSLTRIQGGTGLGLPIAKSLAEMQGGEMTVVSEVNKGSIFSITIPTDAPDTVEEDEDSPDTDTLIDGEERATRAVEPPNNLTQEMPPVSAPSLAPTPQMLTKREVLLIEDNKDMVDQFRRVLQREGFEVVTADHPAYAEAMASNMRPTVIVMDVNFAGEQGWNILTSLKERDDTFDIPVVVVTLSDESERAYQTGVYEFIQRPFDPEDIVAAVLEAEKESNTERILIIDDHPDDIRLLMQVLNESGSYKVFSAASGKEGVSMVARRRPDLIILDLRMPEMDGFAVLDELRSNPETARIPVMVVTGEVDFNADEQEQLGNVRVLPKTSISEEEYEQFIADVRKELSLNQ